MRNHLAALLAGALTVTGLAAVATAAAAAPAAVAATTASPTLLAPVGTTVSANPVLQWNPVSGASRYHVEVAPSLTFAAPVYDKQTTALRATPDADLPLGDLYWRVAAVYADGSSGPFSGAVRFTKAWGAAPTPIAPVDNAILSYPGDPAVFSWDALPGAKSYSLQIDDSGDFASPQEYQTTNATYTLAEPQTVGQSYFWRVRAQSTTSGVVSAWSTGLRYSYSWLSTPTLTAPPANDNGAVTDLELSWSLVHGARSYEVQVSPNGDWANNVTLDTEVKATSYTPPTALLNGSYFWRVRAIDAASPRHYGTWSDAAETTADTFSRSWPDKPTLLTPVWDAADPSVIPHVSGTPVFSWTPARHASHYELQFSVDPNFSNLSSNVVNCYTNHTSWTPYHRLAPLSPASEPGLCPAASMSWGTGITYYWRVRGIDAPAGVLGLWSATVSGASRFIRDPDAPNYVSPPNDPSGNVPVAAPTLVWTPVSGAESYRVTVVNNKNSAVVKGIQTYATSYTPVQPLAAADGPFQWYVQAVDSDGVSSAAPATSQRWQFSVTGAPSSGSVALTGPADGADGVSMPTMRWTAAPGVGDKYTVFLGLNNGFQTTLVEDLPYTSYTDPNLPLTPGTYSWWVEARGSDHSYISTSTTQTFTVDEPDDVLGPSDYLPLAGCTTQQLCADTPTFTWRAMPHAGSYVVTIANDRNFTNVVRTYVTSYTSLTPRESLLDNQAGQAYYWFVRPCQDADHSMCGPGPDDVSVNHNAATFQKHSNPVTLVAPADGTTVDNQVTFRWTDYLATGQAATLPVDQEAKQYVIQVSTVADFATILDAATVDALSYTAAAKTYPNGPLYWRVQAADGSTNPLTWSPVRLVTKTSDQPTTTYPVDGGHASGVPSLQWHPVDYAAQYAVEVYRNGDVLFSPANRVLSALTKFAAWAPTTGLPPGDYAWRVQSLDADGHGGPWSAASVFHLTPAAPGLTTPGAGITATSPNLLFGWTASLGATQYRWQLSPNAAFNPVSASQTTVMTAWAPLGTFADGSYYWRVQALDSAGNVLSSSPSQALRKDSLAPKVTTVTPASDATITSPFTAAFSEAVTSVSTATFRVTAPGSVALVPAVVRMVTPTKATWTPISPLVPGQTYTIALTRGVRDLAGNALVARTTTVRTSTTVENTSPAFVEHWDRDSSAAASAGSYDESRTPGSSATFTFTSTSVSLVGMRSRAGGYAAVYLDGRLQTGSLSFYNGVTQYRHTMWSRSGLADARHTLQVTVLGTKPKSATDSWVNIDAFTTARATHEQTEPSVREAFRRIAAAAASGGSYDTTTHSTAADTGSRPSYTVSLRGTRITVHGTRSASSGRAAIYIDNALRSTVDLRSATVYRATLYTSPKLADKVHTVRIDVLGTASGAGSSVGIDYVTTR